jgi:Zn-dependent protease/CBS domain-containing protein
MGSSWRIARIMGIEIRLDASWFIIFFLIVYSLGFVEFPRELHPGRLRATVDVVSIALGVATSLLLFASVLAHELSHSWMAIQRGTAVKRITLFIFGGVAQIASEPDRPSSEFLIAIMGPLMSVALAAIFGAAWLWLQITDSANLVGVSLTPLILLTSTLFQVNGSLALFNLAPGFPLDGGRVLRAVLWGWTHNILTATKWASRIGQFIAVLLIASSGFIFFTGGGIGGIWYALIGVFLWNAASEGYRQTALIETLRGVNVNQLMTRNVETVSPSISIAEFVDRHLLAHRDQTFAVSDGISFQGVIGMQHLRRVPRSEWTRRLVRDVMTPIGSLQPFAPYESAASALTRLSNTELDEMPVVENGQVIGFLGQGEMARYLKLKTGADRV